MKNKLLRISALILLIAISGFFVYENGFFQNSNLEKKSIKNNNPIVEEDLIKPVVKTQKELTEVIPSKSNQNFNKKKVISAANKMESNDVSVPVLSEEELDS